MLFVGKYPAHGPHGGIGPWLDLIQETNEVRPGTFDVPTRTGSWWTGGTYEEYPGARVVHGTDRSVTIVALTNEASAAMVAAEKRLQDPELRKRYDRRMGRV